MADTNKPPDAIQIAGAIVSLIGLGPALVVALILLVVIVATDSSSSVSPDALGGPSSSAGVFGNGSGDLLSALTGDDGKGQFAADAVPRADLVPILEEAGRQCDLVSPVVLAAQIQVGSEFDPQATGPHGEDGIAQLPEGAFATYGRDDDGNGRASADDLEDAVFAQARYLCALGDSIDGMLSGGQVTGNRLTLTLLAWDVGLTELKKMGRIPLLGPQSYPYRVRAEFARFEGGQADPASSDGAFGEDQFTRMFPDANPFYRYTALTSAMAKYPAFGQGSTGKREIAAFLANVDRETGGLVYAEELNQSIWGNYCDLSTPYGCPAGRTAYHGRGALQLSGNANYKAAGDALGVDLLNRPSLVSTDPVIAWETAVWFWMTQSGSGPGTPHATIAGAVGFGGTIRSINGSLECGGGNPDAVHARVDAYRRFCAVLGVTPGDNLTC
ncbi:glycoside hydrolase family 19 protein [Actinoplanes sp. NPDC051343]|uniref:glycoside hydrolase family 19 protein n=1 Tax=Actinoplanes sp. NPDC051343 TaxID=3363906 RepID=UPI0037A5567B